MVAGEMESPETFAGITMEQDDTVYSCKGCGEVCYLATLLFMGSLHPLLSVIHTM